MKKIRSYSAVLDYLYNALPMFQRQGAPAMKKDLTNIVKLCEALGNPHKSLKTIHVAGTNGKGSTCHILSALLQSQGYSVGLYSSPHYKDFRERIKINSELVSRKFVIDFVNNNRTIIERIKPSFFEITVAMAFSYFAEKKPDYVIVEVGLGGRLDSTNIITPELSIITNISKDHTQFLGDTIPLIAGEKAGIIKQNVPVIIGERQEETTQVFSEKAKAMKAELMYAENKVKMNVSGRDISLAYAQSKIHCTLPWFSSYQKYNIQVAWTAFHLLMNGGIDEQRAKVYLENMPAKTYFLGRWMKLSEQPLIIAESAHNEAGLRIVMEKLKTLDYKNLFMVLGFSSDKDLSSVLPFFPKKAQYLWAKANIPRGMNADYLHRYARIHDLHGKQYSTVR
jgi:dihydrofolate synthase/folylpolyglutamate synthase